MRLSPYHAGQVTQSRAVADFFEATVAAGAPPQLASNWITGELARKLKETGADITTQPVAPERLAELIRAIDAGTISGSVGKSVFEKMFESGRTAAEIIRDEGLTQIDDESQLVEIVTDVLARNADAVAQYRSGKAATFGFLVGQVMKAAGGKANPKRVNELLRRALDVLQ